MTVNTGVYAATYSPDGRLIATAYDGGMIGLVNAQTGEEIAQLSGHTETVLDLTFSPDGVTLASAGGDGAVRLWSMGEYLDELPEVTMLPIATVTSRSVDLDTTMLDLQINTFGVQFSPSGYQIAFGASDGVLRLWIPTTGEILSLSAGDQTIEHVAYSPGRSLLATGGVGEVRIWDTRSNRQIFAVNGGVIDSIAFNPDGQTFAFGGDNDIVEVWSLRTRERLYAFADASSDIEGLSFSPNGVLLAASAGYQDGHIRFYNLTTGELVRDIDTVTEQGNAAYAGTFSPDGTLFAAVSGNGGVFVWDAETGEEVTSFPAAGYGLTFSPDSTLLAGGDDSGIIYLWNARTGEQVRTISGHSARVEALAFSPDGAQLVSTSEDGTVRLWEVSDE
jgi:WD40 repeat protein